MKHNTTSLANGLTVINVGTEAFPVVQAIAHRSWKVAYSNILSPAQMDYMLDMFYSTASLQHQVEVQGHQFVLVKSGDTVTGFAAYSRSNAGDVLIFKLHKIYVDPVVQGSGSGKTLLNVILEEARSAKARWLELNVNRNNPAVEFYRKFGFEIIAEQDNPIGNGYFMNDYLMRLPLV